jgi:hypothetical protein
MEHTIKGGRMKIDNKDILDGIKELAIEILRADPSHGDEVKITETKEYCLVQVSVRIEKSKSRQRLASKEQP